MARTRNIKPGFFTNEDLAEISPEGRLLFIGLWTLADREGRLEDRPKKIKAEIFPYENIDVDSLLDDLDNHLFIKRYCVAGKRYIQVMTFTRHQKPHPREAKSVIPEMPETLENTGCSEKDLPSNVKVLPSREKEMTSPAFHPSTLPSPSSPSSSSLPEKTEEERRDKEVITLFENVIHPVCNLVEIDELHDMIKTDGHEAVMEAIKEAGKSRAKNIRYIEKCLSNWRKGGKRRQTKEIYPVDQEDSDFGLPPSMIAAREAQGVT